MTEPRALVTGVGEATPALDPTAYLAPTCVVVGRVTLAAHASVWYGAVLRGDADAITVGPESNIQDNCSVHTDPGFPLTVGARVSVGHNAVLHGCVIEDDVLVGMGATVLNGAHIGAGSLIAAQALVPQGMRVPPKQNRLLNRRQVRKTLRSRRLSPNMRPSEPSATRVQRRPNRKTRASRRASARPNR